MTEAEARTAALTAMATHGLLVRGWTFRINNRLRNVLGRCNCTIKVIELSGSYIGIGTSEDIRDTILHEIAHALCPIEEGHGEIWKATCVRVGAKPERCGKNVDIPGGWVADCTGCNERYNIYKQRDERKRYKCRNCNRPVMFYPTAEAPPRKNIFGIPVDNPGR